MRLRCSYPLCNAVLGTLDLYVYVSNRLFCCADHAEKWQAQNRHFHEVAHRFHETLPKPYRPSD